ncbi:uncharacterized protein J3D65DRAFT_658795 [Phyllosticta citribraziliensis]|uniref:Uncharacterized protein n=1 Tax=Phyllosticta citribraziliensis TaxID=989973 RepID=A0ABR1LQC6_9PEZI
MSSTLCELWSPGVVRDDFGHVPHELVGIRQGAFIHCNRHMMGIIRTQAALDQRVQESSHREHSSRTPKSLGWVCNQATEPLRALARAGFEFYPEPSDPREGPSQPVTDEVPGQNSNSKGISIWAPSRFLVLTPSTVFSSRSQSSHTLYAPATTCLTSTAQATLPLSHGTTDNPRRPPILSKPLQKTTKNNKVFANMPSSSTPSTPSSTPQAISVFSKDDRLYHGDENDRSTWCQLPSWAHPGDKCNCGKMEKTRPRATPCPWAKPTTTTTPGAPTRS